MSVAQRLMVLTRFQCLCIFKQAVFQEITQDQFAAVGWSRIVSRPIDQRLMVPTRADCLCISIAQVVFQAKKSCMLVVYVDGCGIHLVHCLHDVLCVLCFVMLSVYCKLVPGIQVSIYIIFIYIYKYIYIYIFT